MRIYRQGMQYIEQLTKLCRDYVALHQLGNYAVDVEDVVPLCSLLMLVLDMQDAFRNAHIKVEKL